MARVSMAVLALAWSRLLERGSWVGIVGVLGAAIVMGYTAIESWLENRAVLDATVGWGLLVVMAASVLLRATATVRGVKVVRKPDTRPPGVPLRAARSRARVE